MALAPGSGRDDVAPRPVGGSGPQAHDRAEARACLADATVEPDLALGDDRDLLAQPLGMGDDVGREDHGDAGATFAADQLPDPALVQCLEASEALTEPEPARPG